MLKNRVLRYRLLAVVIFSVLLPLFNILYINPLYNRLIINLIEDEALRLSNHLGKDLLQESNRLSPHLLDRRSVQQ